MTAPPRQPRVFATDDPDLVLALPPDTEDRAGEHAEQDGAGPSGAAAGGRRSLGDWAGRGVRWGVVLASALTGTAFFSLMAWVTSFVALALTRNDWIGWATLACLLIAAFAALMIVLREVIGLARVNRLAHLKAEIATAITQADPTRERRSALHIARVYEGRRSLSWNVRRFRDHLGDVHDPGELLALAEREIMLPLDAEARRLVTRSAKRVATVTALSPMAAIAVGYVLIENLRLLRTLATLYGGRPGTAGVARLARMVFAHIVATGGVAMTDDLLGQFLGHDILHRLSRRLGEGAFNGTLTARIGVTALEVIRPMPFQIGKPPRIRDVLAEVLKPIVTRQS